MTTLLLASLLAGTTLTWDRIRPDGAAAVVTLKCEGGHARFDGTGPSERAAVVLWDASQKKVTMLRPADKSYMQLDEAAVKSMRDRAADSRAKMKEKLDRLPPEARAKAEAMMGSALGDGVEAEWTLTPKGKKAKVGKWECELYDATKGSLKLEECLVPWSSAPASKDDFACLKGFHELFKGAGAAAEGELTEKDLAKLPGLPVQTTRDAGDGKKATMTLRSVEKGAIAADAFVIPAGFTEKKLP